MNFSKDEWDRLVENCGFTDDELEIIVFLRRGWYGMDIAEELSISHSTLKRRRMRIAKKIKRYLQITG